MEKKKYLEYKEYIGSIAYSRKDKYYYGKVLGLSKVILSYKGYIVTDLENNFKSVIDEYLDDHKKSSVEPQMAPHRIIISITEFVKHMGMYFDLAGKREIIITRFQGEQRQYFTIRLASDIL